MLPRHLEGGKESSFQNQWNELGQGLPTLLAFAQLASAALQRPRDDAAQLSHFARALLVAARKRGVFELRANTEAFQSADRLLAVCVELDEQQYLMFRQTDNPRRTQEFLEGFRQLCAAGLVMHQSYREFSLTAAGFAAAEGLNAADYKEELQFGQRCES